MKTDEIYRALCMRTSPENIAVDEPMSRHTTFHIGGPADYFVTPQTADELAAVIAYCKEAHLPHVIIGNGSNLLVDDAGVRGVVIQLFRKMQSCRVEGTRIRAGAGALLSAAAQAARDASLTGMEFAAGIPGTLGGAVMMNAGAYGGEMKDILCFVDVLDESGAVREIPVEDLALGYRTSAVKQNGWIVLGAVMQLEEGDVASIDARMAELREARTSKQPLQYPSAGSTFKRPEGHFAGKLIMDAGLAGYTIGGAQVSEKHCGFVINRGNATARDVCALIAEVRRRVIDAYGVVLEPEVKFLGAFEGEEIYGERL